MYIEGAVFAPSISRKIPHGVRRFSRKLGGFMGREEAGEVIRGELISSL